MRALGLHRRIVRSPIEGQYEAAELPEASDWIARVRRFDRGFLRGLPDAQLELLLGSARAIVVPEEGLLWSQGSGDGLFAWIVEGRMRVERDSAVIEIMQVGDVLGLSSIHERPHTAAVRAIERAHLIVWDGVTIRGALESSPRALIQALGSVTELVGSLNAELVLLRKRAHATQLVAWHLVRMDRLGRSTIDLTHAQLASRIGIAPRVLHEALGALARARVIRLEPIPGRDDESIAIDDPERARGVSMGRETVPID